MTHATSARHGSTEARALRAALVSACLALLACGGGGATDAGHDAGDGAVDAGPAVCIGDTDCDDGLFCNGPERCAPDDSTADAMGCAHGDDPCLDGQTCDEATARCRTTCEIRGDADRDGHDSIDCDGDDCDDADPNRYPGKTEVCDVAKHDEDCDPTTFGIRDVDMDGYPDATCCNIDASDADVCGTDCQDAMPGVHPTESESCNGIDDDCDGMIDQDLPVSPYYADCDADGFGATGSTPVMACDLPRMSPSCTAPSPWATWATNESDCLDTNGSVHAGTSEDACNGIDDNCDGVLSPVEDADRDGFASVRCGGTDCDDTLATIYPGAPELCDGRDDDCSSATDPGGEEVTEDADHDHHSPATAACMEGWAKDDCDDVESSVYGGATELCDGLDNDCNGMVDDEPMASADCPLDHVDVSVCSAGACAVDTCASGWGDCDGDETNGCEQDVLSDVRDCGVCGASCLLACLTGGCDEAVEITTNTGYTCIRRASGRMMC